MSAAGRHQGRRRPAAELGVASVTRLLTLLPQAFLAALPAEIGALESAGPAPTHRRRASHSPFVQEPLLLLAGFCGSGAPGKK